MKDGIRNGYLPKNNNKTTKNYFRKNLNPLMSAILMLLEYDFDTNTIENGTSLYSTAECIY